MKFKDDKSGGTVTGERAGMAWPFWLALSSLTPSATAICQAKTAKEIDVSVDVALEQLQQEIPGGKEFIASGKGVL